MDCSEARRRLASGEAADAEVEGHLGACTDCAAFACEGHRRAIAVPGADPAEIDRLLRHTERRIGAEAGIAAWLESRPTRLRLAVSVVPLGFALLSPRADLAVYPLGRLLAVVAGLAALIAVSAWMRLRPAHRAPLPAAAPACVVVAGLAVVGIDCLLPEAHAARAASLAGGGADLVPRAVGCLLAGIGVALPAYVLGGALDRSRAGWLVPSPIGALFAGLAGYLALHLHCPLVPRAHLATGHLGVLVFFFAVNAALGARRARA
jgi:hypothetical protein